MEIDRATLPRPGWPPAPSRGRPQAAGADRLSGRVSAGTVDRRGSSLSTSSARAAGGGAGPKCQHAALDRVAAHVKGPPPKPDATALRPRPPRRAIGALSTRPARPSPPATRRKRGASPPCSSPTPKLRRGSNSISLRTRCSPPCRPQGPAKRSELHLFNGEGSYRIRAGAEGPNELVRGNSLQPGGRAERRQAVRRGRLELNRPLNKASIRVLALETGAPRASPFSRASIPPATKR